MAGTAPDFISLWTNLSGAPMQSIRARLDELQSVRLSQTATNNCKPIVEQVKLEVVKECSRLEDEVRQQLELSLLLADLAFKSDVNALSQR